MPTFIENYAFTVTQTAKRASSANLQQSDEQFLEAIRFQCLYSISFGKNESNCKLCIWKLHNDWWMMAFNCGWWIAVDARYIDCFIIIIIAGNGTAYTSANAGTLLGIERFCLFCFVFRIHEATNSIYAYTIYRCQFTHIACLPVWCPFASSNWFLCKWKNVIRFKAYRL